MSWQRVKLGDVSESCLGKMLDQNKNKGEYQQYLSNIDVRWGYFDFSNLGLMKFEKDEQERYGLNYGDLVICEGGEPGRCAIWKDQIPEMKIQKALHRVRVDKSCLDNRFLFYWFLLAGKTGELEQYFTGATIKHMPGQKLKDVMIPLPPLEEQRRIANILSAYDDLIENNRKQIKLLEEAAQRLYKEWFIDLRFPGHEHTSIINGVPQGWKIGNAENFFKITIGKTPPRSEHQCFTQGNTGIPWVSISDMGDSGIYIFSTGEELVADATNKYNVKIVPTGTVLLSFKLTLGRVSITTTPSCTNEAIAHFYISDDRFREYTYLYLKHFEYDTLGNTSSISKAINSSIVKAMPFVMPDYTLVSSFSDLTRPIFKKMYILQKCVEVAQATRDRLAK